VAADEAQGNAAVDLAGGPAGGQLEVREIDFAHFLCVPN
jgi:hypothetical protein